MNRNLLNELTLVISAVFTIGALVGCGMLSNAGNALPAAVYNNASAAATSQFVPSPAPSHAGAPSAALQPTSGITVAPNAAPAVSPALDPAPSSDPVSAQKSGAASIPTLKPSQTPNSTPSPTPKPSQSPATIQISPSPTTTPTPLPTPKPSPTPSPAPKPTPAPVPAPSGNIVLGYYGRWAAFSGYTPDKIPASRLTHLDYAFAKIGSDMKITVDDPSADPGNLSSLARLKNVNPNLKILISVGGWNDSGRFSDMAATGGNRDIFADSVVAFILKYHLDGIDIDWEYPVSGGQATNSSSPDDKRNFTLLLATLREKLDRQGDIDGKHYWLTIAGSAGSFYAGNTELSKIHKYIDYALVMAYDIHGNWEPYTDFNSPLYLPAEPSPQYKWSADSAVRMYISAGFPASKLVLGIPFYGYVYNGVTNANNGLYQSFASGTPLSYDGIQSKYASDPSFREYMSGAGSPWLFNGSTFISYENEDSIAMKTDYIRSHGLAGAGVWEISQNRSGSLLKSIFQALR